MTRPLIGITVDLADGRHQVATGYTSSVRSAGGTPVLLPCEPERAAEYVHLCDGLVLSGGDDPIMEAWSVATHPQAKRVHPRRQAFELALLEAVDDDPQMPVLGVCLGMQLMGLHRGGGLDQCLGQTRSTSGRHWPKTTHPVSGALGEGLVHSHHRQALADPGSLEVVARAADGVIEAVRDAERPHYVGVQWHPERSGDGRLGAGLFAALVEGATLRRDRPRPQEACRL